MVVKAHPNNNSLNRDLIASHNQKSGVQKLDAVKLGKMGLQWTEWVPELRSLG